MTELTDKQIAARRKLASTIPPAGRIVSGDLYRKRKFRGWKMKAYDERNDLYTLIPEK